VPPQRPDARLAGLTFGQLRVFQAVYEERSIRRAAERLGLSPSAVSHALANLRHLLADELFIRRDDGMAPSARAQEIHPRLRAALDGIRQALGPTLFDPASSARRFHIACLPFLATAICAQLAPVLTATAPHVELVVTHFGDDLGVALNEGRLDLAIGPIVNLPSWLSGKQVFTEPMVFVLRRDHPACALPLTLERLASLQHVDILIGRPDPAGHSIMRSANGLDWAVRAFERTELDARFTQAGLERRIALTVPDTFTAPLTAAGSDMVAFCARRAARSFSAFLPIELRDPPFAPPATPITMVWARQRDQDPALAWLREQIITLFAKLPE